MTATLILAFLCVSLLGQRQTFIFERMGESGALPDASFVLQDSDGIIWLASFDGLYYYDGTSYRTYRHDPEDSTSLSGNRINCLFEDTAQRLWVGTIGYGVNISDASKRAFSPLQLKGAGIDLAHESISDVTQDHKGRIWLTTSKRLLILEEQGEGRFELLNLDSSDVKYPSPKHFGGSMLYRDRLDRIWLTTRKGVYRYDSKQDIWHDPVEFPNVRELRINDIREDNHGQVWISTRGKIRLHYFDESSSSFISHKGPDFNSQTAAIKFCFDKDNMIWASEFGYELFCYNPATDSTLLKSSQNSNALYMRFWRSPYVDNTGNIWVCGDGVFKYAYPEGFKTYIHNVNRDNSTSAIYNIDDEVWMAFREIGVIRYDMKTHTEYLMEQRSNGKDGLASDLVYSMIDAGDGHKLLGEYGAIELIKDDRVVKSWRVGGAIRSIYKDMSGQYWAAGNTGLFKLDAGTFRPRRVGPRSLLGSFLQTIVQDQSGKLWIASEGRGLLLYDPADSSVIRFNPESEDCSIPSWRVNDIVISEPGVLWLGTDIGLVRFDSHNCRVKLYNSNNDLHSDFIASVLIDDNDDIWVSTNSGISRFDRTTERFSNFGIKDGLNNVFYYPRARSKGPDGTLYFGGREGIDFFKPGDLRDNPFAPGLKITSIDIPSLDTYYPTSTEARRGFEFSYKTNLLNVNFTGLHFSSPEDVSISYMLEGMNDEWTDLGAQRDLSLTAFNPGDYTLHLRGYSPDGVASTEELVVPIHIKPPFWGTTWFRLLAAALLATGILLAVRYRERSITAKAQQRATLEKQMLDLEKKALLAQMNPHFIFNSMNSIQQYIFEGDNEGAMKYLSKFSRLLRNVLMVSSKQLIALSSEIQLIRDYIELEQMRFPEKFDYSLIVDPDVDINSIEISPFLIQPQVENAIQHGILNKPDKGHIRIQLSRSDLRNIKVTVEDNGIGRAKAAELGLANKFKHAGRATNIVRERLQHNEHMNGHDPYEIIDLHDNGKPSGTRVVMLINTH